MTDEAFTHIPVLPVQTVSSFHIIPRSDAVYVDGTTGGGGHAKLIYDAMEGRGIFVLIDRDPEAIAHLRQKFSGCKNVIIIQDVFFNLNAILDSHGIDKIDYFLADLGMSTHQLLELDRGFSFKSDARLDMRMSKKGLSAYDVVNEYPKEELKRIFYEYGDERFAPQIAAEIERRRSAKPIERTSELAQLVSDVIPDKFKRNRNCATAVFQAIRYEVNGEIDGLEDALKDAFNRLKPGGVESVITFNSLEAAVTKRAFSSFTVGCRCPRDWPVCRCGGKKQGRITVRNQGPDEDEIKMNPASRSARLWSIKKTEE